MEELKKNLKIFHNKKILSLLLHEMMKRGIPIAKRLQKTYTSQVQDLFSDLSNIKVSVLDEEIKMLEKQLIQESGSSDNEDDEESLSPISKNTVVLSSINEDDRIPPLPVSLLPKPGCAKKFEKKNDGLEDHNQLEKEGGGKRVRFQNTDVIDPQAKNHEIGLEKTVNELLRQYKPTSAERKPFWCRICLHQSSSLEEFETHKSSELHKLAESKERKLSYCKLCRKQFTSPYQLKEHIKGKQHHEKFLLITSKQNTNKSLARG